MKKKIIVISCVILLGICIYSILYKHELPEENFNEVKNIATYENNVIEEVQKEDFHVKLTAIGAVMCHNSQYIDAYVPS